MFEGYDTRLARYGQKYQVRRRITSEEQYWRDQYERVQWEVEHGPAAA